MTRLILSFILRVLKPSKHLANVMNFIRDLSRWLKIFFMNSSLPSTSIPVARYTFSNSSLSSRLLIPKTSSCTFFEAYKTPKKLVQVTNLQPGGYSTPDPTLLYIYWTSSEAAITQIQLLVNLVARTLISQIQWRCWRDFESQTLKLKVFYPWYLEYLDISMFSTSPI